MLFATFLGVPLGFLAAKRYGSVFDHGSLVASLIGISIPIFLGLILKYIFSVRLGWLPSIGREDVLAEREHPTNFYVLDAIIQLDPAALQDAIRHLILPAIALATIPLAIVARITRAAVLDVQNEDYVRTARAKGLPPRVVNSRHVMRNALLAGLDDHRVADRLAAVRSRPHRNRFRLARDRHLAEGCDLQPRLPGSAGRDPLRGSRVRPRQSARGHLVRGHQSPDPGPLMSVAELESREIELEAPSGGLWSDAFTRLRRNPGALVGFALVALFVVVAVFAPLIAPAGPREQNLALLSEGCCPGPSADHWFGVDQLGRDEFSRIVYGARYSLVIGVVAVSVGLSLGLLLGALAGYIGGGVDSVVMRLMDIMLAIPGLLFAIGVVAVLGPGLWQVMVAVGVVTILIFARLRGSVLAQKENDFVLAARAVGVPRRTIVFSHILPNAISLRDRGGDARDGDGDHRRCRARLPRPGLPGSGDAGMGHDAD